MDKLSDFETAIQLIHHVSMKADLKDFPEIELKFKNSNDFYRFKQQLKVDSRFYLLNAFIKDIQTFDIENKLTYCGIVVLLVKDYK